MDRTPVEGDTIVVVIIIIFNHREYIIRVFKIIRRCQLWFDNHR